MHGCLGRILYDIPCKVCRDHSSGKHYGIFACDGCAGFFKRSIRRNRQYVCKAKSEGGCTVDKTHRNQCRACRLAKCIEAGMNKDAVQHERGPRNSTLRRQMGYFYKEQEMMTSVVPQSSAALDLALPKPPTEPRVSVVPPTTHHQIPHPAYCNMLGLPKVPITIGELPIYPLMPTISVESICEQAARLLFLNIKWTRDLIAGTELEVEDQLILLKSSWRELFLLATAQLIPSLDPTPLIPRSGSDSQQEQNLAIEVSNFRNTIGGFREINLDQHEYACIRAIVLFKNGLENYPVASSRNSCSGSPSPNNGNLSTGQTIIMRLHESAHLALGQRLNGTFGTIRLRKILLFLPSLKSVSARAITELFFKRTIGNIPMEKIICDMYRSDSE
ncbi:hypothetical protein M0802_013861 [Mischocyttarus mexicanus]|nr:hypothetical protein M0802_013861 [Mischocyttarus mexicanus]